MTMSVLIGSGYFNAFLNKNNNKIPILRIHEIANQKIKESDRI